MFIEWCTVCHGEDGRGRPPEPRVKTVPMDFTDCRVTTPEADADWRLVVTHGGAAAGRSSEMPGFEVLPALAIAEVVAYVRTFCRDTRWPSGNLNFPRSTIGTKAFPEDEVTMQLGLSRAADSNPRVRVTTSFGARVGRRGAVELTLPAETVSFAGHRQTGIGDAAAEGKYVLYAGTEALVTAGVEVSLATGSHRWGFGEGTAAFEPFVAMGVARGNWIFQGDVRALLPGRRFPAEPVHYTAYNVSVLRPTSLLPKAWTIGAAATGVDASLSVGPQVLKGLTRTGSLAVGASVEIPVRPVSPRAYGVTRWSLYLLWDYLEPLRARP